MSDEILDAAPPIKKKKRKSGVLYNTTTGQIESVVGGKNIDIPKDSDIAFFEGYGTPELHYIDTTVSPTIEVRETGIFAASKTNFYNDGVDEVIINCPNPCYIKINGAPAQYIEDDQLTFSTTSRGLHIIELVGRYYADEIVLRAYTQEEAAKIINDKLNAEWEAQQANGFVININGEDVAIDSDIKSRLFLSTLASRAARGKISKQNIKTKDNKEIEVSTSNIEAIEDALSSHIDTKFKEAQKKKKEIEKLNDIESVLSFDVKSGWS